MDTVPRRSPTAVLGGLLAVVTAYQLSITMVIPALPSIARSIGQSASTVGLAQTLMTLAGALSNVFLPIAQQLGRRTILIIAFALAAVGSMLCALVQNPGVFIAGRAMQGFSIVAMPLSNIVVHDELPADRFGRSLGILTMVNIGIGGVDVLLGGWLADAYGYRAIFWVLSATSLLTLAATSLVPQGRRSPDARLDWPGMSLLGLGVTGLLTTIVQGSTWGWASIWTIGTAGGGVLLLIAFVLVEPRRADPLVDVRQLASRKIWATLLVPVFSMAALVGTVGFALPIFSQNSQAGPGLSAVRFAVLLGVPSSVLAFVGAPMAGCLGQRIGWRRVLLIGLGGLATGLTVMTIFLPVLWVLVVSAALGGALYSAFASTAANGLGVLNSPAERPSFLPGMLSCAFAFGASVGIAVSTGVLTHTGGQAPDTGAFTATFAVLTGFALLSVVTAVLIPAPPERSPKRSASPASGPARPSRISG